MLARARSAGAQPLSKRERFSLRCVGALRGRESRVGFALWCNLLAMARVPLLAGLGSERRDERDVRHGALLHILANDGTTQPVPVPLPAPLALDAYFERLLASPKLLQQGGWDRPAGLERLLHCPGLLTLWPWPAGVLTPALAERLALAAERLAANLPNDADASRRWLPMLAYLLRHQRDEASEAPLLAHEPVEPVEPSQSAKAAEPVEPHPQPARPNSISPVAATGPAAAPRVAAALPCPPPAAARARVVPAPPPPRPPSPGQAAAELSEPSEPVRTTVPRGPANPAPRPAKRKKGSGKTAVDWPSLLPQGRLEAAQRTALAAALAAPATRWPPLSELRAWALGYAHLLAHGERDGAALVLAVLLRMVQAQSDQGALEAQLAQALAAMCGPDPAANESVAPQAAAGAREASPPAANKLAQRQAAWTLYAELQRSSLLPLRTAGSRGLLQAGPPASKASLEAAAELWWQLAEQPEPLGDFTPAQATAVVDAWAAEPEPALAGKAQAAWQSCRLALRCALWGSETPVPAALYAEWNAATCEQPAAFVVEVLGHLPLTPTACGRALALCSPALAQLSAAEAVALLRAHPLFGASAVRPAVLRFLAGQPALCAAVAPGEPLFGEADMASLTAWPLAAFSALYNRLHQAGLLTGQTHLVYHTAALVQAMAHGQLCMAGRALNALMRPRTATDAAVPARDRWLREHHELIGQALHFAIGPARRGADAAAVNEWAQALVGLVAYLLPQHNELRPEPHAAILWETLGRCGNLLGLILPFATRRRAHEPGDQRPHAALISSIATVLAGPTAAAKQRLGGLLEQRAWFFDALFALCLLLPDPPAASETGAILPCDAPRNRQHLQQEASRHRRDGSGGGPIDSNNERNYLLLEASPTVALSAMASLLPELERLQQADQTRTAQPSAEATAAFVSARDAFCLHFALTLQWLARRNVYEPWQPNDAVLHVLRNLCAEVPAAARLAIVQVLTVASEHAGFDQPLCTHNYDFFWATCAALGWSAAADRQIEAVLTARLAPKGPPSAAAPRCGRPLERNRSFLLRCRRSLVSRALEHARLAAGQDGPASWRDVPAAAWLTLPLGRAVLHHSRALLDLATVSDDALYVAWQVALAFSEQLQDVAPEAAAELLHAQLHSLLAPREPHAHPQALSWRRQAARGAAFLRAVVAPTLGDEFVANFGQAWRLVWQELRGEACTLDEQRYLGEWAGPAAKAVEVEALRCEQLHAWYDLLENTQPGLFTLHFAQLVAASAGEFHLGPQLKSDGLAMAQVLANEDRLIIAEQILADPLLGGRASKRLLTELKKVLQRAQESRADQQLVMAGADPALEREGPWRSDVSVERSDRQKSSGPSAERSESCESRDPTAERSESQEGSDPTAERSESQEGSGPTAERSERQDRSGSSANSSPRHAAAEELARGQHMPGSFEV